MNGDNRMVLHSTGLSNTYAITLDYNSQVLYWADYSLDKIESSFANGTNRQLFTQSSVDRPFDITVYNNVLYWADRYYIKYVPLNYPYSSRVLPTSSTYRYSYKYGVQVVAKERQPLCEYPSWHYSVLLLCTEKTFKIFQSTPCIRETCNLFILHVTVIGYSLSSSK